MTAEKKGIFLETIKCIGNFDMLKNFVIGGLSGMIATSVVSLKLMIRL
jgi:hypothetical protein